MDKNAVEIFFRMDGMVRTSVCCKQEYVPGPVGLKNRSATSYLDTTHRNQTCIEGLFYVVRSKGWDLALQEGFG